MRLTTVERCIQHIATFTRSSSVDKGRGIIEFHVDRLHFVEGGTMPSLRKEVVVIGGVDAKYVQIAIDIGAQQEFIDKAIKVIGRKREYV